VYSVIYVFGDCELDTPRRVLRRAGKVMPLRRKVFQVLTYLLERHDRVVSKAELCEAVWPQQFISDAALESTIKAVRQAIGDSGRAQRLIRTVHGYGYRCIAAVTEHPEAVPGLAVEASLPALPGLASTALQNHPGAVPGLPPAGALEAAQGAAAVDTRAAASAPRGSTPGEWKPVTVLCCAPVPALPGAAPPAPEARYRQIHALYGLVRPEVQGYGGTLQPVVGEYLLAVFGAPLVQEDHAQRAVLAALAVQQRLGEANTNRQPQAGEALAVRLGLHTGVVALGGPLDDPALAGALVGDTVTGAIALQAQAAPGTILCSEATARRVHGVVRVVAAGPVPGAPPALPVPAYRVLGRRAWRSRTGPRPRRVWTPLVGRTRELAILHALWAQVEEGRGQVVGIVGEPGIGKSRLVYEFHRSLRGTPVTYLTAECLSYTAATPYRPILALLRHNCGLTEADAPTTVAAKVRAGLAAAGLAPEAGSPYLLHLLGVTALTEEMTGLPPPAIKAHTRETLVQMALHGARQRPLVLEVENLHWIDPSSEEVLAALVERLVEARILLLLTYRPGYQPPWCDRSYATQLALLRLTPSASQAVVQANLRTPQVAEALVHTILAKGDGNPFFLEELARAVGEHDVAQGPLPVVPDTVQVVLAARLDRLPPTAKHLLQVAAVIGKEIPLSLLQAVADLPEAELEVPLAQLQAGEFLYEVLLEGVPAYTFKHTLTQEGAYGSLLPPQRRALHQRTVVALEALYARQLADHVEPLAHHAWRGEVWEKVVTYGRQAGAKAFNRAAFREATTYYEQALATLGHLPETLDTMAWAVEFRLDLVRHALRPLMELDRSLALLREAETCARVYDDRARLSDVLSVLASVYRARADLANARVVGQQALALASALGDLGLQAEASYQVGQILYDLGDYERAAEVLRHTVEALEASTERLDDGYYEIRVRAWLARAFSALGQFAEGRRHGAEALRQALVASRGEALVIAYGGLGHVYLVQGDLEVAIRMLEQGLARARAADERAWGRRIGPLGYAYVLADRLAEGQALLEEACRAGRSTGQMINQARHLAWLSAAGLLAGQVDEAGQYAHQALALARQYGTRGYEALALRQLGAVHAYPDAPDAVPAEACYQEALALAQRLGMRPLQAHCHLGLGVLYAKLGRQAPAHAALSAAMALYRAMDMTFWLDRAEAACTQVQGRPY
jgi:DNA-binding winged helix-turn-helix (wHTH) protein/class 3 adenylate cyclase/tetratricopeptide (TPR) repeat protein